MRGSETSAVVAVEVLDRVYLLNASRYGVMRYLTSKNQT